MVQIMSYHIARLILLFLNLVKLGLQTIQMIYLQVSQGGLRGLRCKAMFCAFQHFASASVHLFNAIGAHSPPPFLHPWTLMS